MAPRCSPVRLRPISRGNPSTGAVPRYLQRVRLLPERVSTWDAYPFSVPVIRSFDLELRSNVTFLIGENGSGKSTIIEGLAGLLGLPLTGGGRSDIGLTYGPKASSELTRTLRPSFRERPRDCYYFRGEFVSHYALLLDERKRDRDFLGNPYAAYGGKPLTTRSHGEGFLAIVQSRVEQGLYLLDEPEVALSPQRQLALMALIADRAGSGDAQFIIATHSPMIMTIPEAQIVSIEDGCLKPVALEDTDHYRITKAVLQAPASFWRHLKP